MIVGIDVAKEKHYAFFGTAMGKTLLRRLVFDRGHFWVGGSEVRCSLTQGCKASIVIRKQGSRARTAREDFRKASCFQVAHCFGIPVFLDLPGQGKRTRVCGLMLTIVEQKKAALTDLCRRFRVRRLDLFGSATKGTFEQDSSDLDFLVVLEADSSGEYADNYLGLAEALEALFERKVDLVTERSIRNPYFRKVIDTTRKPLYEN